MMIVYNPNHRQRKLIKIPNNNQIIQKYKIMRKRIYHNKKKYKFNSKHNHNHNHNLNHNNHNHNHKHKRIKNK